MRSSGDWKLTGVIDLVTVLEVILTGIGNRVRNYSENLVGRKKNVYRLMYIERSKSVSSACNALIFFFSIMLRSEALVYNKYFFPNTEPFYGNYATILIQTLYF